MIDQVNLTFLNIHSKTGKIMTLSTQLNQTKDAASKNIPADIYQIMTNATEELIKSGIAEQAPKTGDSLANFELYNQLGEKRSLSELTQSGPVVVTFYRGGWCPYCNLELRAYQAVLNDIQAAGATLVAISPELPDESLSTKEKNELEFEVLTDTNSNYAKELGLIFNLPEELRSIYLNFGIDVQKHNGENQFDLPLAATFVIDTNGIIVSAFVDADYTKRKEPAEVVKELKSLT